MNMRPAGVVVLLLLALVAASCGDPANGGAAAPGTAALVDAGGGSDAGDGNDAEVTHSCGPVEFGADPVDLDRFEPFTGELDALIDAEARPEFEASLGWWEAIDWFVVESTDLSLLLFGRAPDPVAEGPGFGYAMFELRDDGWRAAGWGGCHVVAGLDGFGVATFMLDVGNPPDPASTSLAVLATERDCASGRAPVDREVLPVVVETGDTVEITVLVESPTGDQTCQGSPPFPLVVALAAPLGDRLIRDTAIHPGEDRPWPLAQRAAILALETSGDAPAEGTANVVAWGGESPGGLLFTADGWSAEPTWFQSFDAEYQPEVITGFVTTCDGCEEECEGSACDALPRLGPECSQAYTPVPGLNTTMTIRFAGNTCSIVDVTSPID